MDEKRSTLELDRNPSPKSEAEDFSTADEKTEEAKHKRNLDKLRAEQGPVGKLIGSSDSSLNISFVLLILGFIAIAICGFAMIWSESAQFVLERLITFELTVAGYVMGKRSAD